MEPDIFSGECEEDDLPTFSCRIPSVIHVGCVIIIEPKIPGCHCEAWFSGDSYQIVTDWIY